MSLSLQGSRRRAATVFRDNSFTFQPAPADGNGLLYAITRPLGFIPHAHWTSGTRSRWMRLLRAHLALYCDSRADEASLISDQPLGIDVTRETAFSCLGTVACLLEIFSINFRAA